MILADDLALAKFAEGGLELGGDARLTLCECVYWASWSIGALSPAVCGACAVQGARRSCNPLGNDSPSWSEVGVRGRGPF